MSRSAQNISRSLRWRLGHTRSRLLKKYADLRVGSTKAERYAHKTTRSVVLSFDDYGAPAQVHELLDLLAREHLCALFFLQGDWTKDNEDLVATIRGAGHIVGNHTYSHPDLLALSDEQVRQEINDGPASTWLRPPRGRYNARIRRLALEIGYRICYWTIDSDDWQGVSAEDMTRKVLAELHPGAVILFHIHGPHTLEALPGIISGIRSRGYTLASFDEPAWKDQGASA